MRRPLLASVLALAACGEMKGAATLPAPPSEPPRPTLLVGVSPYLVDACSHLGRDPEITALFRRACDHVNGEGCRELAVRYYCGATVARDVANAARLAQLACDLGQLPACDEADKFFSEAGIHGAERPPHGVPAEVLERAYSAPGPRPTNTPGCTPLPAPPRLPRDAFLQPDAPGSTRIVIPMAIERQATEEEEREFVPRNTESCRCGDLVACRAVGLVLVRGGSPVDKARGVPFLSGACDAGDAPACLGLGECYARGDGVPRDTERGADLMTRACDMGYGDACTALARARARDAQ
jgi:TPR repeat protein